MKVKILGTDGKEKGSVDLPQQFKEEKRADVLKKVREATLANQRQPYGSQPHAGMRHSADLSRRRRDYRGSYGHGISRVPRKIMSRRGTRFNWVAAVAPGTVGGRRAHPPKASKIWNKKINTKEKRLAIRSALSFNVDKEYLLTRGFFVPIHYPFILANDYEKLTKTKEVISAFASIGLEKELARGGKKSIRPGRGKSRGRKYKKSKGPLLVVSEDCMISKSARNISGIDVINVKQLSIPLLCPGPEPGRITLFTEQALKHLVDHGLYLSEKVKSISPKKDTTEKARTVAKQAPQKTQSLKGK